MEERKVLALVAGRSGGHLIPGMTFAKNFTKLRPEYDVLFFSTDTTLDRSIIALYPYVFTLIPLHMMGVPGTRILRYPHFFVHFFIAFFKSISQLRRSRPEFVMGMGGYVSLPVCLAAWVLRIPFDLFNLDAVPGKANLWLASRARTIYICFPEAAGYFKQRTELTSYPLRFGAEDQVPRVSGLLQLGLDPAKKTLLILGGSQGSQSLNHLIVQFFQKQPEAASFLQVIHQAGAGNSTRLDTFYKEHGITALVFDYLHDLQYAYAASDLCIARSGAGTVFELVFFERRAVLIPLEVSTTSHQLDNAQSMVKQRPDLFVLLRQQECEAQPEKLADLINRLR